MTLFTLIKERVFECDPLFMARLGGMFMPFWNSSSHLPPFFIPLVLNCSLAFLSHLTSSFVALTIFYCLPSPTRLLLLRIWWNCGFFFFHVLAAKSRQGFYEWTCDWLRTFLVRNRHYTIVVKVKSSISSRERLERWPLKRVCNNCGFLSCCRWFRFAAAAGI